MLTMGILVQVKGDSVMKILRIVRFFLIFLSVYSTLIPSAQVPAKPQAAKKSPKTVTTQTVAAPVATASDCSQIAAPIFTRHIQDTDLSAVEKTKLQEILNNLYLGYFVRQSGTEIFNRSGATQATIDADWDSLKKDETKYTSNPFCNYTALKQNPREIQENKICMDTSSLQQQTLNTAYCKQNLQNMYEACGAYQMILQSLAQQLTIKNFKNSQNYDALQMNYITFHLQRAISRLAQVDSIQCSGMTCTPKTTGDVRDQGMIVNIQNNSDRTFKIYQSTVDGKTQQQIGLIKPGLNNLNLYLASLQGAHATPQTLSEQIFNIVPDEKLNHDNTPFSIQIMTGTQLLTLLKSINKDPKGLFYMNGRKIAEKYAVDPKELTLVLIKIPTTNPEGTEFPLEQRIQAISLDQEHPYFLTMQINEDEVEYEIPNKKDQKGKKLIVQPSFFSIQSLPGQTGNITPVILPDFLAENKNLKAYTLLLQTAYIATITDFKFFDQKCFANEAMGYNLLGYFDDKEQRRIVLNDYSIYLNKKNLYEISNIIEGAIFETYIRYSFDIPLLYLSQGMTGKIVSNEIEGIYFNLNIYLLRNENINLGYQDNNLSMKSFGQTYQIPFQNDLFVKLPISNLSENVFVKVQKIDSKKYEFTCIDKNNQKLHTCIVYPSKPIENIQVDFLDGDKNWVGSTVPKSLLQANQKDFANFKINYTYDSAKDVYQLHTSAVRPIDKIKVIHEVDFFNYPITDMYLDLYHTYQVSTIYRCVVTQNGQLPSFLQSLSQDDWSKGIYMITEVLNNDSLNPQNPGSLTLTFYQSDGATKLGQVNIKGQSEDTQKIGIIEPVKAYDLGGKSLVEQFDIYLNTGIIFKYQSQKSK